MPQNKADKEFLHELVQKYYVQNNSLNDLPLLDDSNKGICSDCNKRRKLGLRGKKRGRCNKCAKVISESPR